jgi:hypothetical protein
MGKTRACLNDHHISSYRNKSILFSTRWSGRTATAKRASALTLVKFNVELSIISFYK